MFSNLSFCKIFNKKLIVLNNEGFVLLISGFIFIKDRMFSSFLLAKYLAAKNSW